MKVWRAICLIAGALALAGPAAGADKEKPKMETATLGAGCFWCVEAVFEELKGIESVEPGYSGGQKENPSYEEVSTGKTGHAEVAQIVFDPTVLSFKDVLEIFWKTHDPTTLNRQGADVGTQYRSIIFYHDDMQKKTAEEMKKTLDESGAFKNPIVTAVAPLKKFYPAENYHRDYFKNNPNAPYCRAVIAPKMEKFRKAFKNRLNDNPDNQPQ